MSSAAQIHAYSPAMRSRSYCVPLPPIQHQNCCNNINTITATIIAKKPYPDWCHDVGSSANSHADEYNNKGNYNSNSEIRSKKLAFECSPHHDYESVECNNLCPDN